MSPNILSRSGGVRVSQPTTKLLNPGAYRSMVSNTAGHRGREGERRRSGRMEKRKGNEEEGGWRREDGRKERRGDMRKA